MAIRMLTGRVVGPASLIHALSLLADDQHTLTVRNLVFSSGRGRNMFQDLQFATELSATAIDGSGKRESLEEVVGLGSSLGQDRQFADSRIHTRRQIIEAE